MKYIAEYQSKMQVCYYFASDVYALILVADEQMVNRNLKLINEVD